MSKEKLSESQLRVLMTLEEKDALTYEKLAELSGLSYDGVRGRVSELTKMGFNIERTKEGKNTLLKYEGESNERKFRRPTTYGDLISARHKSLDDFYGVIDSLEKAREAMPKLEIVKDIEPNKDCGVLILSDLHFGEIIKEDDTIVYNTEIARARMEELTSQTLSILENNELDYLYIAMVGDMVDGDSIYRNHLFNIEKPAIEQVQDVVEEVSNMIKVFVHSGIQVEVGAVRGNHGITNYKNLEQDNWDNVVYDMLNLVFRDNEMVKINHYQGNQAKVKILDRHAVLYHGGDLGDQIKTASGLRQFRGMAGLHKLDDGDLMIIGDRHSFGVELDQNKLLIRNGALPGASEYAIKLNLYSHPEQTFLILEEGMIYPKILPIEFEV